MKVHLQNKYNTPTFNGIYRFKANHDDFEIFKDAIVPVLRSKIDSEIIRGESPFERMIAKSIEKYAKKSNSSIEWALNNINKRFKCNINLSKIEDTYIIAGMEDITKLGFFVKNSMKKHPFMHFLENFKNLDKPKDARDVLVTNNMLIKDRKAFKKFLEKNNVIDLDGMGDVVLINEKGKLDLL